MPEFPEKPLSPDEFFASFLPAAFAAVPPAPGAEALDVQLGVRLEGEGGGEWLVHLERGAVSISKAPRRDAAVTFVQSVEDWRGALWERRGGAIGRGASAFFRPGASPEAGGGAVGAPPLAALDRLASLDGVIKMVVSGGEGGDWAVAFKLGPGEIPAEPSTTVTLSAEDAAAMESGQLDAMQAFLAGRIKVAGDMALMMQMQAIQMQVAAGAAKSGS